MSTELAKKKPSIPGCVSVSEFRDAVFKAFLAEKYSPVNICAVANFDCAQLFFVPVYGFTGAFQGTWECEVGDEINYYRNGQKTRSEMEWSREAGRFSGKFAVTSPATDSRNLPAAGFWEFVDSIEYFPKVHNILTQDRVFEVTEDLFCEIPPADLPYKTCCSNAESKAHKIARDAALEEKPTNHDETRNFSSDHFLQQQTENLFYMPIWFVYFDYQGTRHYAMMDGRGTKMMLNVPADKSLLRKIQIPFYTAKFFFVLFVLSIIPTIWYGYKHPECEYGLWMYMIIVFVLWQISFIFSVISGFFFMRSASKMRKAIAKETQGITD